MEHRSRIAALVLSIVALLSSLAGRADAQERIKFPVGVGTKTIGTNMFWLATKKGFFEEFGLDVQPILLRGSSTTMQALVSESLYLALGSADATIGAASSGADLLAVGGVVNGLTQTIVAAKQYKTIKDLHGATIGVQVLTSGATNVLKRILKQNGLDYPADYTLLAVGGGNFNLAALVSGQIGATYLVVPLDLMAEQQGFHVLVDVTDLAGDYPNTSYATSRTFLKNNPDAVKRFFMAMATAVHEYKRNPELAIKLTQEFLKVKEEPLAKAAYDFYIKVYPDDLRPSTEGIALVLKEFAKRDPKVASVKPQDIVDTSALDALAREGFFTKLAATN